MTLVIWHTAFRNLSALRARDRELFGRTRRAINALARNPRPPGAVPWGASGFYRLHEDEIRVLYEIDDDAAALYVVNVGIMHLLRLARAAATARRRTPTLGRRWQPPLLQRSH